MRTFLLLCSFLALVACSKNTGLSEVSHTVKKVIVKPFLPKMPQSYRDLRRAKVIDEYEKDIVRSKARIEAETAHIKEMEYGRAQSTLDNVSLYMQTLRDRWDEALEMEKILSDERELVFQIAKDFPELKDRAQFLFSEIVAMQERHQKEKSY